ncbi:MAG TPA: hypothetical protein VHW95_11305 [Steroidobacteraceae bacterium]|jgi:hypothetical protein|nr:hypothetical protein [Steroidobacteraceae bacterium]
MRAPPAAKRTRAALRTCERFTFTAIAPLDVTWPLFGADREQAWASDWHPMFIWPANAMDQEGMVFKVAKGKKTAVWVNTAFDRGLGRIQYVYFLPGVVVATITLQLTPLAESTHVAVTYVRTALDATANARVREMAEQDRVAGREWELQINTYLSAQSPSRVSYTG